MTAGKLLQSACNSLKAAGVANPRLDAEVLLAHAWQCDRASLIAHAEDIVPGNVSDLFQAMLDRRCRREPVAYIIGEKEFWSKNFKVSKDVLIPRPETEHLIEAVLEYFPEQHLPYRFCDMGTGSGCIAVTLACEYARADITATDISDAALKVASDNARRHMVGDRVRFFRGDMFDALDQGDRPLDLIISNPPYVGLSELEGLAPELAFEPKVALTDNREGCRHLHELVSKASDWLRSGGLLIVETGSCGLPGESAMQLEHVIRDLAGLVRGGVYRAV